MANVLGKRFTYAVDGVEEEHTMFQRSDVRHVAMEKQPPLGNIHGELRMFVEKESAKI